MTQKTYWTPVDLYVSSVGAVEHKTLRQQANCNSHAVLFVLLPQSCSEKLAHL